MNRIVVFSMTFFLLLLSSIAFLGGQAQSITPDSTPTPRSDFLLPPPQFIATPFVGRPIDWNPLDFSILVNPEGLLNRSKDAQQDVADQVAPFLAPYQTCEIALAEVFANRRLPGGDDVAALVGGAIIMNFPDIVQRGQFLHGIYPYPSMMNEVIVRLYFYQGCEPDFSVGTPSPAASPVANLIT